MSKRRYRRRRLSGVLDLDMGTQLGNVVFGATASAIGNVVGPRLPFLGEQIQRLPGTPGLAVGLGIAGIAWMRGNQDAATDIAIGAVLPSAMLMIQSFAEGTFGAEGAEGTGYVVPTAERLGLVAASAEMTDGSMESLAMQGDEIPASVLQGYSSRSVEVIQGF